MKIRQTIISEMRERADLRSPIREIGQRRRNARIVHGCSLAPDLHDSVRLEERQRAQEYCVYDAEDRGVRSDAEREREHGDGGEAGVFQQLAKGEFQIIHNAMPPSDRLSLRGGRAASRRAVQRRRAKAKRWRTSADRWVSLQKASAASRVSTPRRRRCQAESRRTPHASLVR